MQLGPYFEILENILDSLFGKKNIDNEENIKLKIIFDAMDRPEFLTAVPKVSSQFEFRLTLYSF